MGETFIFIVGMAVGIVVLLAGVCVGSKIKSEPVQKVTKMPKKATIEPMPLHTDPWDNALQGNLEGRIPTVEDK